MAKFQLNRLVQTEAFTYRGGDTQAATPALFTENDIGKPVKLVAANQVGLAAADDEILGFLSSIEYGTFDGFQLVGVLEQDFQEIDTAAVAVNTLVVVASVPALGTAGKAVAKAAPAAGPNLFKWLVVRPGLVKRI